jgi:hypothetical protein
MLRSILSAFFAILAPSERIGTGLAADLDARQFSDANCHPKAQARAKQKVAL